MLGHRAARWHERHPDRQLVIALSVPARDLAATLIGCGWMLATPAPRLQSAREVSASIKRGTPVRMVTDTRVVADFFHGVDTALDRIRLSAQWPFERIRALAVLPSLDGPRVRPLDRPGAVTRMAGLADGWEARMCRPPADLALIGTLSWLREDATAFLGRGGELEPIATILLPEDSHAATWSTKLYAASRLEDDLLLPGDLRAVILDGGTASTYLPAIEAPVVIAVLDRSLADESAAEMIVQYRNSRGNPVSVEHDLHWPPPAGTEALGFWVSL
ncbi:hypothetical protein [Catenulispora rubra]|uniref:hypothetical protein n=1 Tax=Catenulispora rubra TaxID=280293 RepID=UPI001E44F0C6|nr:hypothetical protein [Catenulispora rubra]